MKIANCKLLGSVLGIMLFLAAVPASGAPGDLDPTFGKGGRVFTEVMVPGFTYFYPVTESMLVQPDGKILVCGRFWEDGVSYWYGTYIVRYMPDGTLDSSFGTNGKVAVLGPGYPYGADAVGADMVLQNDGKIIIIGQVTVAGGIIVQRYTSSGMLDTTFGVGGIARVSGNAYSEANAVAVQPDGKIVGIGRDYNPYVIPYYDAILLFRLNADGQRDTSFGPSGNGVVFIDNGYDGAEVFIQSDSKILVVGELLNFMDIRSTLLLARYNSNGLLDQSFGTGGVVTHRINNTDTDVSASALQPDGKIVVSGRTNPASNGRTFLSRYNSNGSLDTAFGTEGVGFFESEFFRWPNTVLLQGDGKIVVTGGPGFDLIRLLPGGSIDPSFGIGGKSTFPMTAGGSNHAAASDAAIQADGKILLVGFFGYYYSDSHENIAIARVNGDTPASSVSISGRVTRPGGLGLANAVVSITTSAGFNRTATTSSFGYYSFENIPTGVSYTISVSSRRYRFQSRTLTINDNLTDIDFVGQE